MDAADAAAAENYLNAQAPIETAWSRALGFKAAELDKETALIAFADTLSLALCGEMKAPLDLEAPGRGGEALTTETRRATPAFIRFRSLALAFPRKRARGRRRGTSAAGRGPVFG